MFTNIIRKHKFSSEALTKSGLFLDNEKGYIINTIIIDDQAYIILNQNIMNDLDFKNKFTNETQFKLIDNYNGQDFTNETNPFTVGLGRFVDLAKDNFIGKKALENAALLVKLLLTKS